MRVRVSHLVVVSCVVVFLGGMLAMRRSPGEGNVPAGPRQAAWLEVEKHLREGRVKSAAAALEGLVEEAIAENAWPEVARGIATRVLAETGDRPRDDPERLIKLDAAIAAAAPQARPVLEAIAANWTWGYFLSNRWRFSQRTRGAAASDDLATIDQWDLPMIVAEIERRFTQALDDDGTLKSLPTDTWTAVIDPGVSRIGERTDDPAEERKAIARAVAMRPTVWDVLMDNAIAFYASGERGLVAPEDVFEPDASGAILGSRDEFLSWKPEAETSDTASPLLKAIRLYQTWLRGHLEDASGTALLAIDLERIRWASGVAVGELREQRSQQAIETFIEAAGTHDLAASGRRMLADRLLANGDAAAAHAVASEAVATAAESVGGVECQNLIAQIEARSLELQTERTWAKPWPVIRADYVNLERVFLRVVTADWEQRLAAGRPEWQWLEEDDRRAIVSATPVRSFVADLPATPDYQQRGQSIPVPEDLKPGCYWVIASADESFADADNIVTGCFVWVSRLALVAETNRPMTAVEEPAAGREPAGQRLGEGELAGHVVDVRTGEPVANAEVTAYVQPRDRQQQAFRATDTRRTDAQGRYVIPFTDDIVSRESVVLAATAVFDGVEHRIGNGRISIRRYRQPTRSRTAMVVTDRGIHRPGQEVFYKGIASEADTRVGLYQALADTLVTVVLRDANNRELATAEHRTNATGSFHGSFSLPSTALPGQWAINVRGDGFSGGVAVRVEEYKRPKFMVELSPPKGEVQLAADVSLHGTANTYTGLPVPGAKVSWDVEREVRFPPWCRWFFPWLPFEGEAARIAHGETTSDADGRFEIAFPAKPDRTLPRDSLPIFSYRVTATVTDAAGETRRDERVVRAGYAPIEANLDCEPWQAAVDGKAAVPLTVATTSLDGEPRAATGTLRVARLVQPDAVARVSFLDEQVVPRQRGGFGRGAGGGMFAVLDGEDGGREADVDPAEPETWLAGEQVFSAEKATDVATGKAAATVSLEPGIYRAVYEVPGDAETPTVKATHLIEVIDPAATQYPVRRGFAVAGKSWTVEPGETFEAIVGTGYDTGRVLIELLQDGVLLSREWSEPGRTQWPIRVPVTDSHRGGFTLKVWMVRDGRLHKEMRTVEVPWTDRKLEITWERFTRRVEPGTREVWRAKVTTTPDVLHPEPVAAAVEMLAMLYDQSLESLAPHRWPTQGLLNRFRQERSAAMPRFTNSGLSFHHLAGDWDVDQQFVEVRLPQLLPGLNPPIGPQGGNNWFFGGAMGSRRGMRGLGVVAAGAPVAMAEMAADAATENFRFKSDPSAMLAEAEPTGGYFGGPPAEEQATAAAAAPPPRRNLKETAFFLPTLVSDEAGVVTIEFTLPDTLTTWQFKGFAHDASLRSGVIEDTAVAVKDLMVEPVVPRFLREGDRVRIPVKLSNRSTGRLAGTVRFALSDTRTGEDRRDLVVDGVERSFDLAAGESLPVTFTVDVVDGTTALTYLATGTSGRAADGEEGMLPVLSRRVLVSQSVPVTLRGRDEQTVTLDKLLNASPDLSSESLVVQVAANPAWYAVLAMPSLVEETDEGVDTLFRRLYVNSLAHHLVTRDPRIARVFEQWRGTDALESPLEKNSELMSTLLAETPWVRDAVDEREARARIGLLFDATRADNEVRAALDRLAGLRNNDGGWPWFPGGQSSDTITLQIVAGFGRLRADGVSIPLDLPLSALGWVDARLVEEAARAQKLQAAQDGKGGDIMLTPTGVFALYARSFFLEDMPLSDEVREAMRFCLSVGRTSWMRHTSRRVQAQLAIVLSRTGDRETARGVIDSLRERAVAAPGSPEAAVEGVAWQGMWWRDPHPFWWSWQGAPIETQSQLIEAFDEVAGDAASVEAMKAWLLSQKRTSRWQGSSATANAVAALLGRGADLLGQGGDVRVTVGEERVEPESIEAGTGFFETRRVRREIQPADGRIVFRRDGDGDGQEDAGFAWGGVHWQYLDDIDNVEQVGSGQLAIDKKLFVRQVSKAGAELVPVTAGRPLKVGDELVVRLVITSDRDYEFMELADHRASLTEPVDVLSGWRWGDGVGWYVVTRDSRTEFFFERMPRGTHVLEYSLRVAHAGEASSGFATLRSRYAPEFSSHSGSVPVQVPAAANQE
ncbi:MAG: hypothetical protein ISQ07_07740 [Pirellulales bacterium]|nr:hypothetical protein [Pirellulales bacterium]